MKNLIFQIGTIRHRQEYRGVPGEQVAFSGPPHDLPGSLFGKLIRTIVRLAARSAFRLYALLSRNRQLLLPSLLFASGIADHLIAPAGLGERTLRLIRRQVLNHNFVAARCLLMPIAAVLLASTQIHLAASRKNSAVRAARLLNLLFRNSILSRRGVVSGVYFGTLSLSGSYDRIVSEVPEPESINGFALNFAIGVAHLYRRRDDTAVFFLKQATLFQDSQAERKLGCAYLLKDDYVNAAGCFQRSVALAPSSVMAHQNYAGRYNPSLYTPSEWELKNAGELLVYDNLIQLGENFYHQGRYDDTFRCYQKALLYQNSLSARWSIPDAIVQRISAACPHFDRSLPVRLLGYEWVTLIGHIGFLDCHLRMVKLGMLPAANDVLLAPPAKVVNQAFLELWKDHFCMVTDPALADDLLPYQRLVGDQFIGFRSEGDIAEPWAHAAARAQVTWAKSGRPPLVEPSAELLAFGTSQLRSAGIPEGAWFVALHIREGGYHGDGTGSTRQHRSANVDDYLPAIEHITKRGGHIIRLGDRSMKPMPGIPGIFDYAHSDLKSQQMDLFLVAACRLFIGTTSGLTSAVQALGTPMLLLNCTSSDCQFWNAKTDFISKPVYDRRRKRYLTLRETYSQPLQAMLIDSAVLHRYGYEIHANSPSDILTAVRYTLNYLDGAEQRLREDDDLIKRYRAALADNPFNFGASLPVRPFLESYGALLDNLPPPDLRQG